MNPTQFDLQKNQGLSGKILIAMPHITNTLFKNSVVYIFDHTPKGATGIIINRTLDGLTFKDLLQQVDISMNYACPDEIIGYGGPMDIRRGLVLHSLDYKVATTDCIDDSLGITSNLDILKSMAKGEGPQNHLIILGFSLWEVGQLEKEIFDNEWLLSDASFFMLFELSMKKRWDYSMNSLGIEITHIINESGHA